MTSYEAQLYRAVVGSHVPTIPHVADSRHLPATSRQFLRDTLMVAPVARPSKELGREYPEASKAIRLHTRRILGGSDPASVVPQLKLELDERLRLAQSARGSAASPP